MINKIDIGIWGRIFSLEVDYAHHKDESITEDQEQAIENFLANPQWIDRAKKHVEDFCRHEVFEDDENQKKDNIFSYVKPQYLLVKRNEDKPRVAIMCNYRYDPEHGLAVMFDWAGNVTVGIQDIIL